MTIKEFAHLCGCNPQTLRYYDHVDLLKPVNVDEWSGYRYYEEEQALTFVKIKNLQKAGFTIEEIKELLDKDNLVIYKAFDVKIAEEEKRLQEIKDIQKSYQTEMTDMKRKLETMRDMVKESMEAYDPTEEFGIDRETYFHMIESVNGFFERMISRSDDSDFEYSEYSESDESVEELEYEDLLNNPDYLIVYERHGWNAVKEFFSEFSKLDDGQDYAMQFLLSKDKSNHNAFANTAIGMLLNSNRKDPGNKRSLSCNVDDSKDGQNHFWLLKRKAQETDYEEEISLLDPADSHLPQG